MMATEATAEKPVDVSGTDATIVSNLLRVPILHLPYHHTYLGLRLDRTISRASIACQCVNLLHSFIHAALAPPFTLYYHELHH